MPRAERRASLRAAHSRGCPHETLTALSSVGKGCKRSGCKCDGSGCRCKPRYYTFFRGDNGRPVKGERVLNRQVAERALTALQARLDQGAVSEPTRITFETWAGEWLGSHSGEASTIKSYEGTMRYAREAFGWKLVRDLDGADVRRFLDVARKAAQTRQASRGRTLAAGQPKPISDSTLAKHLRVLKACLQAAVGEGYALTNVANLHTSLRPKAGGKRPAYFTDKELPRLFKALEKERAVYRFVFKLALHTGLRQGELLALRWGDLHLGDRRIELVRKYAEGFGEGAPKDKQPRTVWLTDGALDALGEWVEVSGVQPDDALVFPDRGGSHLSGHYLTNKVLRRAMKTAGIPAIGERGFKRTFHSMRHTHARLMLESGRASLEWVSMQLGHGSILITKERYGTWAVDAERRQAERLVGVIPNL